MKSSLLLLSSLFGLSSGFQNTNFGIHQKNLSFRTNKIPSSESFPTVTTIENKNDASSTKISATPDLDVVALVVGQENYGFGIVALGEALWSFGSAPSIDHGM